MRRINMDAFILNAKWKLIRPEETIKILRIDSDCKPDLFIGVDSTGKRCLTLKVSDFDEQNFDKNELSNLSIDYMQSDQQIVIRVLNEYFWDLFNDFVISIYNKISIIEDSESYTQEFLAIFYKWTNFFDEKRGDKLSEELILGLFGELFFLQYLLQQRPLRFPLDEIEQSWVGPYDKGHDFEFYDVDFEVKTKPGRSLDVNISSEYQLQEALGKTLELVVVDVDKNYIDGISLKDLIIKVKDKIIALNGDFSFVVEGLRQKNVTFALLDNYDNYRYKAEKITLYDCLGENFPKLKREMLSSNIHNVRYQVRLSNLNSFINIEEDF